MNSQVDRCDRTAYVSGLQATISDIELFEVFNRIAHVEKVIVRNGTVRHALVVFRSVQGLYMVLIHFQGTYLHGRQLHIRPLRESSHANSETIATMFEKAKHQGNSQSRRPASVQERFPSSSSSTPFQLSNENNQNSRGCRNSSGSYVSYGRRRGGGGQNKSAFPNETFSGQHNHPLFDVPHYSNENFHFEDYTEGAKRFDNLANLVRSSTPTDPFGNYRRSPKLSDSSIGPHKSESRSRLGSRDTSKAAPPTWKMELQIKGNESQGSRIEDSWKPQLPENRQTSQQQLDVSMSPQQFLAQIARAEQINEQANKKKRPNLSVINPSLFYEQYPRTSSPVTSLVPSLRNASDRVSSPHDPAVLAYSCQRAPQSAFAGLSPIDTNNCSFITKHLGPANENTVPNRRDLTNDELSDMIVSTGNLRINPNVGQPSLQTQFDNCDEPAPWSPVKRLRAESGSLSTAQFASPQFSPIKSKSLEFNETEDDVFSSENKHPCSLLLYTSPEPKPIGNILSEQKMPNNNFDDINNSRLPSNSHSANPSSDKKAFVFPEYPLCRHSSVPSIAHLVGDLSDFGPLSPHVSAGAKLAMDHSSLLREYHSEDCSEKELLNGGHV